MLKLVIGRAGTGKSRYVLDAVASLAKAGERSVLLVPEQASAATERSLALGLAEKEAALVESRSFRSLCGDIFAVCGHGARERVNDALRSTLVRRAVTLLGEDVVFYRRHRKDKAFYTLVASVIDEMKNGGATAELLARAADSAQSNLSAQKLREIARIWAAYEGTLAGKYQDDADALTAAAQLCASADIFSGKTVFFDGFTGFTHPQFTIIAALLRQAKDVVVTLACDDIWLDGDDAFKIPRKTARHLLALAKEADVPAAPVITLETPHRFAVKGLLAAEGWFGGERPAEGTFEGVYYLPGADIYDETARVAAQILRLVREEGYDWSDIAVVTRDLAHYRNAVERTFALYGVPYFCDAGDTLLSAGLTVFVRAALALCKGLDTENVLTLLKTGLTDIDDADVEELENYVFVWDVDGGAWHRPFTQNPDGLDARPAEDGRLERIEAARSRIVGAVSAMVSKVEGKTGRGILAAVWDLVKACGAEEKLRSGDEESYREAAACVHMLDGLYNMLGEDELTAAEIADLLSVLASTTTREMPPGCLQQVTVGAADKVRMHAPKAVFLLGLNDGVFPRTAFEAPLLSFAERELLQQQGAQLSRSFADAAAREELYLYRAATAASERLYLCAAMADARGAALSLCAPVETFLQQGVEELPRRTEDMVVNAATARRHYARAKAAGDGDAAATLRATRFADALATVDAAADVPAFSVGDKALMHDLLSGQTTLSPSRIETFQKCRFSYFLQYILRVRPLKKAQLSPVEAGSFVHGVLEEALRSFGGDLREIPEATLKQRAEACAEAYVQENLGAAAADSPRMGYLIERLKAQTFLLLRHIQTEQRQSEFLPRDFELRIGKHGDVQPFVLQTADGNTVRVEGIVDRVDVMERDGVSYVRVVDYKTGDKAFRLLDIYNGLNIQMLLYLFTLCENGAARYPNPSPAAVMYMPADPRAPETDGDDEADAARKAYRMDGLVVDDPDIVRAMEKDARGVFIPVRMKADGSFYKTEKLASLEKMGRIKTHIDNIIIDMANTLYAGDVDACPIEDGGMSPCTYCDYAAVCRKDRNARTRQLARPEGEFFEAETAEGGKQDA